MKTLIIASFLLFSIQGYSQDINCIVAFVDSFTDNGHVNDFAMDKFDGNKAYANSKLLVVYFTKELSKRLESENITANCVHPGVVGTDVFS